MAHDGHNSHNGYNNGYQGQTIPLGYVLDYPTNGMQLDNTQHDFNQPSILSQNDEDLLGDFFKNPDNSKVSDHLLHDFQFGMDGKVDGHGLDNQFNFGTPLGTVNPSSTLAGAYDANYHTHANLQQMQVPSQFGGWSNNTRHMTDDESAASALNSLAHAQGQAQLAASGNPDDALSWGNFMNPNAAGMPVTESSGSPMTSLRHSMSSLHNRHNRTHDSPLTPHPMPNRMQGLATQQQQYLQQHQPDQRTGSRARHQSLHVDTDTAQAFQYAPQASHTAYSYGQYPSRPAFFQFGSDPNITGHPYRVPSYAAQVQGKDRNLMALPLAEQAANNGNAHSHAMQQANQRTYPLMDVSRTSRGFQSSDSSPGAQFGGLPLSNPSPTTTNHQYRAQQQWTPQQANIAHESDEGDEELEESQPRKRRKSQMQREEEAEYRPEGHMQGLIPKRGPKVPKAEVAIGDEYEPYTPVNKGSSKRRRSTETAPASVSRDSNTPDDLASPSPGDASSSKRRSRDAKSRANLSENQKRQNHILSEQKRRNVIKQGYSDLNHLVPGLGGGKSGLSKSEILKEVVTYLESVIDGNEKIMERCGFSEDEFDLPSETIEAY